MPSLAAGPAGLDAAERDLCHGKPRVVHAAEPVIQGFGHPPGAREIAREDIGSQPVLRGVGKADSLFFPFENHHGSDRPEYFLVEHAHLRGQPSKDGRLKKVLARGGTPAAQDQTRALAHGVLHQRFAMPDCLFIDEGAGGGCRVHAVAEPDPAEAFRQRFHEGGGDAFLDEHAVRADAGLAGVAHFAGERSVHGCFEIRVVKNDEGGVAAQFHGSPLDRDGSLFHQPAPDFRRPGEADLAHLPALRSRLRDDVRRPGDNAENAFREAGARRQFRERER